MPRELLVTLDRKRPASLRLQLEGTLREAIRSGRVAPGAHLPSTRALASDLRVSRGLVVEAYEQLVAEGYLIAAQGSATTVASVRSVPERTSTPASAATSDWLDLKPGTPDTTFLARSRWLRHLRAAFLELGTGGFSYGDPAGFLPLRRGLASYLQRVRGVLAEPENVVICPGFAGGISLLARLLSRRGFATMAVEDPGSVEVHPVLRLAGIEPLPARVDEDGIDADAVTRRGNRLALCTPAHQFPTGVVLSPSRRSALASWARDVRGYVIEDDYDAEYRYDRAPVGAMQGLAPENVIYAGSLSKTLAPALRLGWLVLPPALVAEVTELRRYTDLGNATLPQAAFALMLESGDYDRHLRRARRAYRQRRNRLIAVLESSPLRSVLSGAAAGLHLVASLPARLSEATAIATGAEHGLRLYGLSRYRVVSSRTRPALVLGYGSLSERTTAPALRRLKAVCRSLADQL